MSSDKKYLPENAARSIGILIILGIFNAFLAIFYSGIVAFYFGTSRNVEIFFAASTMIIIISELSQSHFLSEIFLPIYHRFKFENNQKYAFKAFSIIINILSLVFIPISIVLWCISRYLIKAIIPGFNLEDHVFGNQIFRTLIPLLLLNIILSFSITLLNAEKQFGKPEFVAVLSYLIRIVIVISFAKLIGVWSLVIALIIWTSLRLICVMFLLYKIGYRHSFILQLDGFKPGIVFKKIYATGISQIGLQFYELIINAELSSLPKGMYGVYKYVESLFNGTSMIVLLPVNKVFYTAFSTAWTRGKSKIHNLIEDALARTFGLVMLANIVILVAGKYLLAALWQSSSFRGENIDFAVVLITVFFLLLFVDGLFYILKRMVITLDFAQILYYILTIAYLLSTLVAWINIPRFGKVGLILSLCFFATSKMIVPMLILRLKKRKCLTSYPWRRLKPWFLATGFGLIAGWLLNMIFPQIDFLSMKFNNLLRGSVVAIVACLTSLIIAWVYKVHEVRELWTRIKNQFQS